MMTIEERKQEAKNYRKTTSRKALGQWTVKTGRPEVEQLIRDQEQNRQRIVTLWEQLSEYSEVLIQKGREDPVFSSGVFLAIQISFIGSCAFIF